MPNVNKNDGLKRLLQDLSQLETPVEGDMVSYYQEVLPLVAFDAVQGVDIPSEYPTFYKHLITNLPLQNAFEDAKALLEAERPLVQVPHINLSFLAATPRITWHANGRWQAAWNFTKDYLTERFNIFVEPPTLLAFRDARQVSDDGATTIVHRVYTIGQQQLQVWLRVASLIENDQLAFEPQVTVYNTTGQPLPERLKIKLEWGAYQVEELLPSDGRIRLPIMDGENLFDDKDKITAALRLTLNQA